MKIAAIAPWFGGKRGMGRTIAKELGPHSSYWDLFCGSLAVLFAKERSPIETCNDLFGDVINLALCLQDERLAIELYDRASKLVFHEEFLYLNRNTIAKDHITVKPDLERALAYLIVAWFGRNGMSGTPEEMRSKAAIRFGLGGGSTATRWRSMIHSIPDWHDRLLGCHFVNRNALELAACIEDDERTVIYADPPYIEASTKYVFAANDDDPLVDFILGPRELEEEPLNLRWHRALAKTLSRFEKARVVVSYYEHPILKEIYAEPKWTKTSFDLRKAMANSTTKPKGKMSHAPEVLIVNGPSKLVKEDCLF